MTLFDRDHREESPKARQYYALTELVYTGVDFAAAATFLIGSLLFLNEQWKMAGTIFFIAGSVLFAMKPTIRLAREIKLAAMGHTQSLAEKQRKMKSTSRQSS